MRKLKSLRELTPVLQTILSTNQWLTVNWKPIFRINCCMIKTIWIQWSMTFARMVTWSVQDCYQSQSFNWERVGWWTSAWTPPPWKSPQQEQEAEPQGLPFEHFKVLSKTSLLQGHRKSKKKENPKDIVRWGLFQLMLGSCSLNLIYSMSLAHIPLWHSSLGTDQPKT